MIDVSLEGIDKDPSLPLGLFLDFVHLSHSTIRARFAVFVIIDSRHCLRSGGVIYLSRPRRYIFHYWFFL